MKIAVGQVGVNARVEITASASVKVNRRTCKRRCGRLYLDWFKEWVCPICGYNEYSEELDAELINNERVYIYEDRDSTLISWR